MTQTRNPNLYVVPPPAPSPPPLAPLRNTLASVVDALTHLPEWRGVLASSEFDQRIVFRRAPPWSGTEATPFAPRPLRDRDIDRMRHWFEESMGAVVSTPNVASAIRIIGDQNAFHPVREYLGGLAWDGVPRAARWLENYAAVHPTSEAHAGLVRSVAKSWLLSCVARAQRPGCKVDTMLILEGQQGIGKSTALATLAGKGFYCDSAIDFASKDACQTIQGVWIYELAELDALLRRETSVVKAFLSRASDRFRVPYGRAPETVARSVVFAGTVNHGDYLRDTTGNRRFWVVRCEGPLDIEGLAAARDMLWAEAAHLYARGEAWHLGAADEALMQGEHEARVETDPWEETIHAWTTAHAGRAGDAPVTMNEILESALGLKAQSRNSGTTRRVSQILGRMGFERRRRNTLPRTYHHVRVAAPVSQCPTSDQ